MEKRIIRRGDVYYARLNPVIGSEQGGRHRPVLIISNDKGNRHSTTVIIAAITGMEHAKPNLPTHVTVSGCGCLEKDSIILLEQIRTLDKQRLREYIGTFDKRLMLSVDNALAGSIGLIPPAPSSILLRLCGTCADRFCGTGAYALQRSGREQTEGDICIFCKQGAGFDYEVIPKTDGRA